MYRNSAYLPSSSTTIAQLAPTLVDKHQHCPDTDISRALAEKRKQIDEEIANFKALKEREFRDFEKDLLKQRQRQKQKPSTSPAQNIRIRGDRGSALSLLSDVLNQSWPQVNDLKPGEKENIKPSVVPSIRRKLSPIVSKPTNNITPVTVTATVTDDSKSPSPILAVRQQPAEALTCLTLPPHQQSRQETELQAKEELREQALIVSSSHDNRSSNTNLAAILTPTYLPLLGDYTETQIQFPSSISGPIASSASASISPISQHRRIKTEPIIPSHSLPLPSALRTPSGATIRKHKHVTLQLADSVIVEPSSSYEEGPSPIAEGDLDFSGTESALVMNGHGVCELEQEEERITVAEEEEHPGGSANGLLERRRMKLGWNSVKESGENRKKKRQQQQQQQQQQQEQQHDHKREQNGGRLSHSLRSPLGVSVNDTSGPGVGFFELDEELASSTRDARFIDDDEDVEDQPVSGRFHKHGQEGDNNREEHVNVNSAGAGAVDLDRQFVERGTKNQTHEYSASVPIDIVKPSGSWVGSFGH